jgi:pyrophosphatase PpaX
VTGQFGVLIDLDQTLVDTSSLKAMRDQRDWGRIKNSLRSTTIMPGAELFIHSIRELGLPYGIVTRTYAESVVRHHQLQVAVVTAYHDTRMHKPHPAPLLHGMSALGVHSGIYLGDDAKDEEAASAAQIRYIPIPPNSESAFSDAIASIQKLIATNRR